MTDAGEVYYDFAMLEEVGGLQKLGRKVSNRRVVFGSNFPLFYFASAALKVHESDPPEEDRKLIWNGNAESLLRKSGTRISQS
jgi:predicted TIM-barrel fold metal-dependent hydrolase